MNCYDKAITSNPRFAYAWDNKGKCLLTLGRHDEAENCFKKAEVLRTKT
ncbi:MAG: tetratricopeptide repeat protein [Halobacteriota archaeon]